MAMNADFERQVESLFQELADLPPVNRERFLHERGSPSHELRERVLRLLAHHDAARDPGLRTPVELRSVMPAPGSTSVPQRIGPYEVLQLLGEGGMGAVYLAEQSSPIRRRVALKVIKLGMDTKGVMARFDAEREALALMNHPNVARVIDAGATEQGRPYFVMEYVEGVPVTQFCDQQQLTLAERLDLFMQVCHAVQHAHQKGIIHRDLKPSNVLVALVDGLSTVKVIDFGIAKATQQKLTDQTFATERGILVGTPAYMSPEQADPLSQDIDTRADIYSLGVILYELLVGALPLDPEAMRRVALAEIQRMIREVDPPKPSSRIGAAVHTTPSNGSRTLNARQDPLRRVADCRKTDPKSLVRLIRGDLDWIVLKCLEKDRARRYDTANALVADLQRYRKHEPVTAGPPSRVYRVRKFVRRNRGAVTAAALVALALIGGLASTSVMYARARAAELRERDERLRAEDGEADAEQARARIQWALEDAEHMTQFLTDMLSAAGPWEQGINVTVREVLDKAAARVGGKFADRPLIEARLERTLGQAYIQLGLFDAAKEHITQAAAIYTKALGPQDAQTLVAVNLLGEVLKELGHTDQAEAALRSTLEIQRRVRGEESPETLRSRHLLAVALGRQGRFAECEKEWRELLEIRRRVLGEEHLDTQACVEGLGISLSQQGRYVEGEEHFRKALEKLHRFVREDHPDILGVMGNLANNLNHQGRLQEAERLFRETIELKRRVFGAENSDTVGSMQNLALNLHLQGRHVEAEELGRKAIEVLHRIRGPEHEQTLFSIHTLALSVYGQGRYPEAEELFRRALEGRRRVLGPEHPNSLNTTVGVATCLQAQGRYAEADEMYRSAMDVARRVLGEDHPSTLTFLGDLAGSLAAQGRSAEAEILYRQAIAGRRQVLGNDHPDLGGSLYGLAEVLLQLRKWPEAEDLAREALEICKEKLPVNHPDQFLTGMTLGAAISERGRFAEAEPLLLGAYEGLNGHTGISKSRKIDSIQRIVRLYELWHAAEPEKGLDAKVAKWSRLLTE